MRINVYDEEITGETQRVTKIADTGKTFHGVRLMLASPAVLHDVPGDDDRSAVTLWWETLTEGVKIAGILRAMAASVEAVTG